jgi:hypothetical protein
MLRLNCDRWSTLPVVLQMRRQAKPRMHRLLPNRVVGRRESRDIESAHGHSADRRIAVSLPIKRGAAIRAEMKSNPIAAVGVALVDLPLPIEPHLLFRKTCAEMESGTGAALARLTVAQVNPIRFTRGNYSKRAAVASSGSFHRSPAVLVGPQTPNAQKRATEAALSDRLTRYLAAATGSIRCSYFVPGYMT